jgi:hypothetical protein
LRWPSAALVAAIAWIPYQNAPIGAALSPISSVISPMSMLLMMAAIQLGRERLFPASVWALLLLLRLRLVLICLRSHHGECFGRGYRADASRMGQAVLATVLRSFDPTHCAEATHTRCTDVRSLPCFGDSV